jgi:hypothetical protein
VDFDMVMSNPRAELPEDAKFVTLDEAHEYGYWGAVPDQEPNHVYTVAGVTGGTAQGGDKPSGAAKERAERNTDALKGGK